MNNDENDGWLIRKNNKGDKQLNDIFKVLKEKLLIYNFISGKNILLTWSQNKAIWKLAKTERIHLISGRPAL